MQITAYLKPVCGWSAGIREVLSRYELPYEECHEMLKPDLIVKNFTELSNKLTKEEDSYAHRN